MCIYFEWCIKYAVSVWCFAYIDQTISCSSCFCNVFACIIATQLCRSAIYLNLIIRFHVVGQVETMTKLGPRATAFPKTAKDNVDGAIMMKTDATKRSGMTYRHKRVQFNCYLCLCRATGTRLLWWNRLCSTVYFRSSFWFRLFLQHVLLLA